MKCIYIGDFRKDYSTENYVTYGLEQNGVEVKRMHQDRNPAVGDILEFASTYKPDFVLFSKNKWPNGKDLIRRLRSMGIPTASWIFDLYVGLPREMATSRSLDEVPFATDIVFMTDGGHNSEFSRFNRVTLRQGIHAPEAVIGEKKPEAPILFIGSATYHRRTDLLDFLKRTYGERFKHYGAGGGAEVRGLDLNSVVSSAKIVVGDSVPSQNYWSNRIYEIIGRGGFLLHPKVDGLEKEFAYYKHFIPFDYGNLAQVKEIIDYYLVHDAEREAIRLAGHTYCKQNLTYTHRCKEMIKVIRSIGIKES